MDWNNWFSLLITMIVSLQMVTSENSEDSRSENCREEVLTRDADYHAMSSKVLSRRKRYLTFPDGSSFQFVFCLQTSALITIGDIFLYANTAAMAWQLPNDPDFFLMVKNHTFGNTQRRGDQMDIIYVDSHGKPVAKVPYKRSKIINPVFAKRSVDEQNDQKMSFKEKLKMKIDRMKMHERQLNRDYLKREHMNERSVEFHRRSRVGLYEKVEKLITALGRNGRQCVLHKLCDAARSSPQGTFLQEILRVVFTLPKGNEFEEEYHQEYDKAHTTTEDCLGVYSGCEH